MRILALVFTVAALLPASALGDGNHHRRGGLDFAFGRGVATGGSPFKFWAVSGPSGEHARGFVRSADFNISAPVGCLDVRGAHDAVIGGVSRNNDFGVPTLFAYFVSDNGHPGAGVDVFGGEFEPANGRKGDAAWCTSRADLFNVFGTILSGDIFVHDAQPHGA